MNRKEFLKCAASGVFGASLSRTPWNLHSDVYAAGPYHSRTLGRTGLRVSFVGYGASRVEAPSVVRRGIDMGINFVDTGRMYQEGKNEEMLGKVLQDVRTKIIIQSKFLSRYNGDRAGIEKSIEESLKALRTDYIDIMLMRGVSSETEAKSPSVFEALTKAKESGKIRFTGISSHEQQAEVLRAARMAGFYDVAQVTYNHAGNYTHSQSGRYSEWDQPKLEKEIEKAVEAGMGIIAMKTCSAGPYKEKDQPEATYRAALMWIRNNPLITAVVPGMANFTELEENIKAMM